VRVTKKTIRLSRRECDLLDRAAELLADIAEAMEDAGDENYIFISNAAMEVDCCVTQFFNDENWTPATHVFGSKDRIA